MTSAFTIGYQAPLMRCAAGVFLALLCGCASMSQSSSSMIAGTRWTVTELDGAAIAPGVVPTLAIAEDGGVSGSDGCNRFAGGLVFDDGGNVGASRSAGVSTKMACPGARDAVARRYNALRAAATAWRIEGDTLIISTREGTGVRLRRTD